MRQLLLLRHAKSSWDDPGLADHARPLNPRGRRAGAAVAQAIRELGLSPDVVLVSSARRTLQTLELIRPALEAGTLVEPMDALYLAPWQSLLGLVREAPETARSVMLIGHNPGLHDLAMALVGATGQAVGAPDARRLAEGYPTAALAEFSIAVPWRMLEAGGGRLIRFLVPRDLAAAGEIPSLKHMPETGDTMMESSEQPAPQPVEPAGAPPLVLEFDLAPEAAARLARHPAIAGPRAGRRGRTAAEELIWHDTPDGMLAAAGLALEQPRRGPRRSLQVMGDPAQPWLPGTPAAETPARDGDEALALAPIAAFSGRRTLLPLGTEAAPLQAELLVGKLRAVAAERPVARLLLSGGPAEVLALARRLAGDIALLPPAASLAEEGRALARAERTRARRRGAPDLGRAATVEAALAAAIGHLVEVMIHYAPLCRIEAGPEGVHQMRVALRRLRSVLKAFRPAAQCPAVDGFDAGLRGLAQDLGAARDLDVFLMGVGAQVTAAMGGEKRIGQLMRVVEARRAAAYDALRARLDGAGFRALVLDGMTLLLERPWHRAAEGSEDQAAALAEPLADFAARLLDKRWHRLCGEGEEIHRLDAEALHELRLTAKRLRYAAELFAPIWPGKTARRFLRRLAAVQEELGLANDVAVARALVAGLGAAAPAWAVGAIEGFAVARVSGARRKGLEAWEDLMVAKPFWSDL